MSQDSKASSYQPPSKKRPQDENDGLTEKDQPNRETIFNDPVHGSITLNPLLLSIIDTPQFQRLRYIKQLGAFYWVYQGACHNRFEHSIGTAYLCGKFIRCLQDKHKDLISKKDVHCVEVAGLCHDMGHGPFSHVFDKQYRNMVAESSDWTHEEGSCDMFDYMLRNNSVVREKFQTLGLDEKLVKDLIMGKDPRGKDDKVETLNTTTRKWGNGFFMKLFPTSGMELTATSLTI